MQELKIRQSINHNIKIRKRELWNGITSPKEEKLLGLVINKSYNREVQKMEQLAIAIPDQIENLSLPNPELLQFYKDVENRIIWIDGEIDESLFESSKLIMIKS